MAVFKRFHSNGTARRFAGPDCAGPCARAEGPVWQWHDRDGHNRWRRRSTQLCPAAGEHCPAIQFEWTRSRRGTGEEKKILVVIQRDFQLLMEQYNALAATIAAPGAGRMP